MNYFIPIYKDKNILLINNLKRSKHTSIFIEFIS